MRSEGTHEDGDEDVAALVVISQCQSRSAERIVLSAYIFNAVAYIDCLFLWDRAEICAARGGDAVSPAQWSGICIARSEAPPNKYTRLSGRIMGLDIDGMRFSPSSYILMMMLHTVEAAFNNARFKCAYRRRCHQSDKCLFCANNSQEPPATGKMFAHRVLGNLSKIGLRDLKHIEYIVLWIEFRRRK